MVRKLFLISYFKEVATFLPEFAGELHEKKIVFIPTASNVEKVNFFVNSGKKALENLGAIVDVLDLSVLLQSLKLKNTISDQPSI